MNNVMPNIEPTILVIFGITGDLARRKLLPALYHLVKNELLHEETVIIGITRANITKKELLNNVELCGKETDGICDQVAVKKLTKLLHIRQMDITEGNEYDKLLHDLNELEDKLGICMNRLYYLSIPPNVLEPIISFLGKHGLNRSCKHNKADARLLSEKPFGYDLTSAQELMKTTRKYFKESQIFRIDHYLAKETVQNILTFRFNNPIFEPLWNKKYVDYIEVIANEKIGIEGRIRFYEQTGAMRDLIQSHLLQILALMTMEQPSVLSSKAIHRNKATLLRSIGSIAPYNVRQDSVRGQYASYKEEVNDPKSNVETYAALRLKIMNERWEEVPMILRTGKSLKNKTSKIRVVFKPTKNAPHHNVLTFKLQPNEGIELSLRVKKPGFSLELQPADMDFSYSRTFENHGHPDAYERVLLDAIKGDHTLFATSTEILEAWRIVQPTLNEWSKDAADLIIYKNGSNGPLLPTVWTNQ